MSEFSADILVKMKEKFFRYLKIGLYSLLAIFLLTVIGGSIFTYFYKDKIISYFVSKANERLIVPVEIKKMDVSFFQKFPYTSIVLDEISISSPEGFQTKQLAQIPKAYLTLNPFKVIQGKYEIDEFILESGQVNIEINEEGEGNHMIVKKREEEAREIESRITLITKNVEVAYVDRRSDKDLGFLLQDVKGNVGIKGRKYLTNVYGGLVVRHITLGELVYFRDKEIELDALLNIDDEAKFLTIENGDLKIGSGKFNVIGDVSYSSPTKVDLAVEGVETNAQTLISLLPDEYSSPLKGYKSKGEVYFSGTVIGEFSDNFYPNSKLTFGARNAEFYHPDYKKSLENIDLTGKIETGTRKDFSQASLSLQGVKFVLDGHPIAGALELKNFDFPYIDCSVKGKLDLDAFTQSFPKSMIEKAYGEVDMDITFSGSTKTNNGLNAFKTRGDVVLHNVSFILKGERLPFNSFNGSFMFRENDLAISEFSGKVGKSDFLLDGFFKNISSFVRKENKTIRIEADLRSTYLDFDELLQSNFASQDTVDQNGHRYTFHISPKIDLNFNCKVDGLRFKRFYAEDISGNLKVIDQIARFNKVRLKTMGGGLAFDGTVDNRLNEVVEIACSADLSRIYIDSVFYVFKNFKQTWLIDKNLRGQINSSVNTYILLDNHLKFYSDDFTADISASIINGELLNFEPMQRLSKYVEEESLAHLRFSEVRNDIEIRNKTIYIPKMLVSSSITNIMVSGTHTFDQKIDYHVAVPLSSFLRLKKLNDQQIATRSDGSHLLLRIAGTTSDYTIRYDTEEVKKKIARDIRDEGQELKEVFKNKGKEKEAIVVEEDDYFEFDKE